MIFDNFQWKWSISIANRSAHRQPTEMSQYFLESSYLSIEYWPISVSGLGAKKSRGGNPPHDIEEI